MSDGSFQTKKLLGLQNQTLGTHRGEAVVCQNAIGLWADACAYAMVEI